LVDVKLEREICAVRCWYHSLQVLVQL